MCIYIIMLVERIVLTEIKIVIIIIIIILYDIYLPGGGGQATWTGQAMDRRWRSR